MTSMEIAVEVGATGKWLYTLRITVDTDRFEVKIPAESDHDYVAAKLETLSEEVRRGGWA